MADGQPTGRSVRPDGASPHSTRAIPAVPAPPADDDDSCPTRTSCRSAERLPPAADDPVDRRPAGRSSRLLPVPEPRSPGRRSRSSSCRPTRARRCSRSSSSTWASRCAATAGASCCASTGFDIGDARLDRDHLPVVARQLRRAGQARRRLPRLPAQDQQRRLRSAARSGRSSSSAILDIFAIAILGLAAGFWSFRSGLPPAIQVVFLIGVIVVVVLGRRPPHHAQLRAPDPERACRCRTRSSSCTTASRRACSARSRLRAPAAARAS